MVQRIENAIPPMILEYLRTQIQIQNEERWSFSYPKGESSGLGI
jgi:hypothetical protein